MHVASFRLVLLIGIGFLLLAFSAHTMREDPLLGFSEEGARQQRDLEARFDALLDKENLRAWMEQLTAKPHHVGSPFGKENAEFIASLFRSWGFETEIDSYLVLFPTPKERKLELVAPEKFTAQLDEPPLTEDATSRVRTDMLPSYNAYSADGDVTGDLVYVNYGIPEDYEQLERLGIDVAGKIVLARYGGSWRGIKPKVAAEHGAVGCIIYSDPRDDGYFQGDVYPEGSYRNEQGAQRGSVLDMPLYPGDPLTEGVGATASAARLAREEAPTLMKIPVLPISYADALPLLKALGGPVVPAAWRGALPVTYHAGPGPARVHLKLAFDWQLVPAYNVIARLRGATDPDAWVLRGNHHDAWVFGAQDPISGLVALMEEAHAVGELAKTGWRPRRTIVYAAWDAEEPGLLGSTEWAEDHAEALRTHAVAYINSDSNGRGFLNVGGSQTLETFVNEIARSVTDPQTNVSVAARAVARRRVNTRDALDEDAASGGEELTLSPLGSGSDYTPFLQHLGIASLNIGFGGESGGGSYHSIYDSYDYYTRFGDPSFDYGIALAQTAGRAVLRLANADVLPFTFEPFARHVESYVSDLERLANTLREEVDRKNALLADSSYELAADPTLTYVPPVKEAPVPYLNFAPLHNALARLKTAAQEYDEALNQESERAGDVNAANFAPLNEVLMRAEQAMTRREGLPRRAWFKHQVYAPGFYTGYGVKTLPGVREAIEQKKWEEVTEQVDRVAQTLTDLAEEVERATKLLREE